MAKNNNLDMNDLGFLDVKCGTHSLSFLKAFFGLDSEFLKTLKNELKTLKNESVELKKQIAALNAELEASNERFENYVRNKNEEIRSRYEVDNQDKGIVELNLDAGRDN